MTYAMTINFLFVYICIQGTCKRRNKITSTLSSCKVSAMEIVMDLHLQILKATIHVSLCYVDLLLMCTMLRPAVWPSYFFLPNTISIDSLWIGGNHLKGSTLAGIIHTHVIRSDPNKLANWLKVGFEFHTKVREGKGRDWHTWWCSWFGSTASRRRRHEPDRGKGRAGELPASLPRGFVVGEGPDEDLAGAGRRGGAGGGRGGHVEKTTAGNGMRRGPRLREQWDRTEYSLCPQYLQPTEIQNQIYFCKMHFP